MILILFLYNFKMSVENNKGDKISKFTGLPVRKYNRKIHLKEESDLESLYTSEDDNLKNKRQKNSHIFKLPQHNLLSLTYKKTEILKTCKDDNLKDDNSKTESLNSYENKNSKDNNSKREILNQYENNNSKTENCHNYKNKILNEESLYSYDNSKRTEFHISELPISSEKTQVEDTLINKRENVLDAFKTILELSQNILKEIKNDNENFKKEILKRIDENTNNIKLIRETEVINNTNGRVAPYLDTFQRQNQESRNMFNYYPNPYYYPNPHYYHANLHYYHPN